MKEPQDAGAASLAWLALRPSVSAFRSGAQNGWMLREAAGGLPPAALGDLEACVQGDVPQSEALKSANQMLWTWLRNAAEWEALSTAWATAMAHWDGRQLTPQEALNVAWKDATPARALAAWRAAREPLLALVDDANALSGAVNPTPLQVKNAGAFLSTTQEIFEDALDYAQRKHSNQRTGPDGLRDARAQQSAWMAQVLPVAAARELARHLVSHFGEAAQQLKRVDVRPLPYLGGFVDVTAQGHPRVGWVERRGTHGLLELLDLSLRAVAWQRPQDGRTHARLSTLGLLNAPVLRKVLHLERSDADAVRRHAAFLLLAQARVLAALTLHAPACPGEALDPLAAALGGDPDVLTACALLLPWPQPTPQLEASWAGPAAQFEVWLQAGTLVAPARDEWDEDFMLRLPFHEPLVRALTARDPQESLPPNPEKVSPAGLVHWFGEALS